MEFITSGRFSKEDEEEDEEEASKHEISFIPTTATTSASPSTASAATSVSVSALASVAASTSATASVSTSALGGYPFRSRDDAGASGSGGGGGGGDTEVVEKEHMFDKVVTPSDVGKLNRLVIPKQHAEKYFPLDAAGSEKGLLLSFEDRTGKSWRFRYSYWNSSQSYVMTKGWSRFVKEKRLDAGDTVSFSRGAGEAARDRLFIDWRCRPDIRDPRRVPFLHLPIPVTPPYGQWGSDAGFFMRPAPPATLYEHRLRQGLSLRNMNSVSANVGRQLLFFGSAGIPPRAPPPPPSPPSPPLHTTVQSNTMVTAGVPVVLDSVPVINSQKTGAKRLRLFGVNLDSTHSDSESSRDVNALSLQMPGWQPSPPPLRLPALPPHGADCSAATSPSSSSSSKKEAHSSLDLDL